MVVQREVLPHVPDAWIDESASKIGYEISFTRYFYKPQPLRTLEEIKADIVAVEKETEGLLGQILCDDGGPAMSVILRPYPAYKDSDVPWLGKVPEDWKVSRIKAVLRETDRRSTNDSGVLLSLSRRRGLISHSDMTDKLHSAKTLVGYKCYCPGQIVMNRMQAWSGMFGAGSLAGLVSPDYAVFDVLGSHHVRLILERLKTPDLIAQFALESKGIGSGFNRLYTDRFGSIPISLPPLPEQTAILRFLDSNT